MSFKAIARSVPCLKAVCAFKFGEAKFESSHYVVMATYMF